MKKEFNPSLLNPARIFASVLILLIPIFFISQLIPKAIELNEQNPNLVEPKIIIIITILASMVCISGALGLILSARNSRIIIENNLMSVFGRMIFGNWKIRNTIALNKVNIFSDRKQVYHVSTAKGPVRAIKYWWVANYEDGRKEEFLVNVWDKKVLIELGHYIQEKFPKIKFNTEVFRDSPERISGLDEYMNINKR